MSHGAPTAALQEQAALYALDALESDEARRLEGHLAEGCVTCEAEVRAFESIAADLAEAVAPIPPSPTVRERLLARARAGSPPPATLVARATDSDWIAGPVPGAITRVLHRDPATRRITVLGRLAPGAPYPAHVHADTEELYLLEGELHVGHLRLRAGDYCAGAAGSRHAASVSPTGCTFIAHASEDDQLGADATGSAEEILVVRAGDGEWRPGVAEGVSYRVLREDARARTRTALVRMASGAVIPPHRHDVGAQVYLLEGHGRIAGVALGPGDHCRLPDGTVSHPTTTQRGCTFLLIAARDEVLV